MYWGLSGRLSQSQEHLVAQVPATRGSFWLDAHLAWVLWTLGNPWPEEEHEAEPGKGQDELRAT